MGFLMWSTILLAGKSWMLRLPLSMLVACPLLRISLAQCAKVGSFHASSLYLKAPTLPLRGLLSAHTLTMHVGFVRMVLV